MLALCHLAWCHSCHFEPGIKVDDDSNKASFYYIWITPRTLRESARCGSTELGWNTKEMINSFFRLTTISNSCRVGQDTHWERCRWWNRPTSWPRRRKKVFPEKVWAVSLRKVVNMERSIFLNNKSCKDLLWWIALGCPKASQTSW